MNFNTLTPSAKVLKKLESYASGQPVTNKDEPCIAIINAADWVESRELVEGVKAGIKVSGGTVFVHSVPFFGYANKINPMTAKIAPSFYKNAVSNAGAIIKTNMIDGVVIVSDCDITTAGLLEGCLQNNCPVMVMPLGTVALQKPTQVAARVTSGQITSIQGDEILAELDKPKYQTSFFCMLENLGFCVAGASKSKRGGEIIKTAIETGRQAVSVTSDIKHPRKILTKSALQGVVDFTLSQKLSIGGLDLLFKLFNASDVKTPADYITGRIEKVSGNTVHVTGTAIGGSGYLQYSGNKPETFSGKAWVYQNLEDADNALLGGSIPTNSVVVLQNCVGMDVSAFAFAVEGMGRAKEIAIATDGVCEASDVLTVTMISPNSFENEEFINIQNGDKLTIDANNGRFNSNILQKEVKTRAKRNPIKKQIFLF
ncbi:MAG: dihydroxy-acid dehydratase [Christensenellaceae bacterium]|jgi:dihydroxyacid dehydratase/phosphogluconate dehydratase|nr:dihydroxy-acid dehydratase [Christensenellaceae bacterium]